jgi:glycosyltransferase involved in cell wall biosynthesis
VGLVADFAPDAALAVPVGDDARLAEAIHTALQAEQGAALETAAHSIVASEYLAAQTAERLIDLYRDLTVAERAW